MGIKFYATDPATGVQQTVEHDGFARVIKSDEPPTTETGLYPYVKDFTLNGDGATVSMKQDGSSVAKKFSLFPVGSGNTSDDDIYITTIVFTLADASLADWNEFANMGALGNGCSLEWRSRTRVLPIPISARR